MQNTVGVFFNFQTLFYTHDLVYYTDTLGPMHMCVHVHNNNWSIEFDGRVEVAKKRKVQTNVIGLKMTREESTNLFC